MLWNSVETLACSGSHSSSGNLSQWCVLCYYSAVAMVLQNNPTVRRLVISLCKNLDHKVFWLIAECLGPNLVWSINRHIFLYVTNNQGTFQTVCAVNQTFDVTEMCHMIWVIFILSLHDTCSLMADIIHWPRVITLFYGKSVMYSDKIFWGISWTALQSAAIKVKWN